MALLHVARFFRPHAIRALRALPHLPHTRPPPPSPRHRTPQPLIRLDRAPHRLRLAVNAAALLVVAAVAAEEDDLSEWRVCASAFARQKPQEGLCKGWLRCRCLPPTLAPSRQPL